MKDKKKPHERKKGILVNEPLTIDKAVDSIYTGANVKLALFLLVACATATQTPMQIYITIFAGLIPYTEWECISSKCFDLLANNTDSTSFYTSETICDNHLVAGQDFNWTINRTSFSMDWGLYCDGGEAKFSVISSFFFVGAALGLVISTAVYDRLGRRIGAVAGNILGGTATLAGFWVSSFEALLVLRVLQGMGMFVQMTGMYCWVVELTPTHLRSFANAFFLDVWAVGYVLVTMYGYLIHSWRYIFLTAGITNYILMIPIFFFSISPRFALVRGREKEAKNTLEFFSKLCNNETSMDDVNLVFKERKQNYLEQIKDFLTYPTLRKHTLLGLLGWFIVAVLFYGFSFSWVHISSNLYTGHLIAAVSKIFAYSLTLPLANTLGRRKAMLTTLAIGLFSDLLAMPDVSLGGNFTLESAASLLGDMTCSAAFCLIYLYTSELAPTSHRGMIMSMSSATARVGSFAGTYVSLLYTITDRRVPLALFAGMTCIFMVAIWFLSDSTGKNIPETPLDVEILAGNTEFENNQHQELKNVEED